MNIRTKVYVAVASVALYLALAAVTGAAGDVAPGWDPNVFSNLSTLQIMTIGPDEGEHWSRLWLVVIDGQLYVRLGNRAYGRVQKNTSSPYVKLRIGEREFDKVRLEPTPEMTARVAAAMADKYFLDLLVRHESHPMTARLIAEPAPARTQ